MKKLTFKDLKWVQNIPNYYQYYLKGVCCFCIDNCKPKLYYNKDNHGTMYVWSLCENCNTHCPCKHRYKEKSVRLPLTEFSIKELFTIKIL